MTPSKAIGRSGVDDQGNPIWNVQGFLESAFNFGGRTFDVVLLWTALDYLPEPFVVPVVEHLHANMNSGGSVLSFFHMKTTGEGTAFYRFHVTEADQVEMQQAEAFPSSVRLPTAASSASSPAGRATASFWPRTPCPKSS